MEVQILFGEQRIFEKKTLKNSMSGRKKKNRITADRSLIRQRIDHVLLIKLMLMNFKDVVSMKTKIKVFKRELQIVRMIP